VVVREQIHIDFNGEVMPCCNLRSDFEPHAPYSIGNINDESLIDIFFSEKARTFRRSLIDDEPKKFPCHDCSFNNKNVKRDEKLERLYL